MGCATSSPFIASSTDGILKAAKGAANNVAQAGEETVHEVTGALNNAVGSVKDTLTDAVQNVSHGIENTFNGKSKQIKEEIDKDIPLVENEIKNTLKTTEEELGYKIIPLKTPDQQSIDLVLEKTKEIENKAKGFVETTESNMEQAVDDILGDHLNELPRPPSPQKSIDSLRTSSPEPEIEKALANNNSSPPTPVPNYSELEDLNKQNLLQKAAEIEKDIGDVKDLVKDHDDFEIIPAEATNWEQMADMLGKPQKIATVDALRRIINERRVYSSNSNGGTQIEGVLEFTPPPSIFIPKSRCSSPSCNSNKSSVSPHSSSARSPHQPIITQTVQIPSKSPSRKFLSTSRSPHPQNVFSSPRVVRKRCAVCCQKYNNDENNNNQITASKGFRKH